MLAKKTTAKSKSTDPDRTEKIYLTLPKKYVTALEIIAGDPREKSKAFEKILDDFIEFKEKILRRDGKFSKVIAALKGTIIEDMVEEKITFIDGWVQSHPENTNLSDYWRGIRMIGDEAKINSLYAKIWKKIDMLENSPDLI